MLLFFTFNCGFLCNLSSGCLKLQWTHWSSVRVSLVDGLRLLHVPLWYFFQKEHTGRLVIGDHKSTSHLRSGENQTFEPCQHTLGYFLSSPLPHTGGADQLPWRWTGLVWSGPVWLFPLWLLFSLQGRKSWRSTSSWSSSTSRAWTGRCLVGTADTAAWDSVRWVRSLSAHSVTYWVLVQLAGREQSGESRLMEPKWSWRTCNGS